MNASTFGGGFFIATPSERIEMALNVSPSSTSRDAIAATFGTNVDGVVRLDWIYWTMAIFIDVGHWFLTVLFIQYFHIGSNDIQLSCELIEERRHGYTN